MTAISIATADLDTVRAIVRFVGIGVEKLPPEAQEVLVIELTRLLRPAVDRLKARSEGTKEPTP
jgi:hypothetical protein